MADDEGHVGDAVGESPTASESDAATTGRRLKTPVVYGLVLLLLALSNVPLAVLVWLWPDSSDLTGPHMVSLFGWHFKISPEQQILLVVAFCGLLGGSIRLLLRIRNEFSHPYVSDRFIPWYFLTPPIGAILSVGFYLVVRGGFFAGGTSVKDVSVFAFGGTGVLVGLFAEEATDRLEGAFLGGFRKPSANDPDPGTADRH